MNTFGRLFRISIFGRSHGRVLGVVVDGVPVGIALKADDFEEDLQRRRAGGLGKTERVEADLPQIVGGTHRGFTSGDPLCIFFENQDKKSSDYDIDFYRPSHTDFVSAKKYKNFADRAGGGHFSGRLTLPLVAAGVVAKKILKNFIFKTNLLEVGGSKNIKAKVLEAVKQKDSVGGLISCVVGNIPIGLGEPFFYSVESAISWMLFSIPAVKAVEFGAGVDVAKRYGSQNNDTILNGNGKTLTNNDGGVVGGITNGNPLVVRVAIKPTSSIGKPQNTFNFKQNKVVSSTLCGRHDACIALRAEVVVEAAVAIGLCDLFLCKKG